MRKLLITIGALISFSLSAQLVPKGLTTSTGEFIGFYEFKPYDYNSTPNVTHPTIIFLHGLGERGNGTTELERVIQVGMPRLIRDGHHMRFFWNGKWETFIVLVPQLSATYGNWQNHIIDEMIKYGTSGAIRVNPNRIFITGFSLGGGGTWQYPSSSLANANKLAGVAPVCATCSMSNGCNIANAKLPVYGFHSSDDVDITVNCTLNAIAAINGCGAVVKPTKTIYTWGGHGIWDRAFDVNHTYQNPNLYEWFLGKDRSLPVNVYPIANAGADATIPLSAGSTTLNGTASFDQDGNIVRYIWTQLSGPNDWWVNTVPSPFSATTTITNLTKAGTYVYELKVADNRTDWSTDTVAVNVVSGNSGSNQAPIANAGANTTIALPNSSTTLNGSASYDPDGSITSYSWIQNSGPSQSTIVNPNAASTVVNNLVQGVYVFRLQVTDNQGSSSNSTVTITVNASGSGNQPPVARAGSPVTLILPTNSTTLNGSSSYDHDGTVQTYQWSKLSGPAQFTFENANAAVTTISNLVQGTYLINLRVWDNLSMPADDTMTITVKTSTSTNQPPIANAGLNKTITLPTSSTSLDGTGSSDPDGFINSYAWSQVTGPSQSAIASPSASITTISNLVQGTYTYKLQVTDNLNATSSATVNITVAPAGTTNQLPVSNAGTDITVTLPTNTATLNGTSSYDPDGNIVSYSWMSLSGPAMGFTDPNSPTMTISNLVQATYSFQLKVTDNQGAVDYDTVNVFVKPSGSTNQPPIANAGSNTTITLPTSSTTLNGSGSSDPDGVINIYLWSQVGGPSQAMIANPNAVSTSVSNLIQGTYTFKLQVTDNQNASASANVSVTVAAGGGTNQLPVANAGADITITLPTNTATLNGTASFDPDGNIVSYAWVSISGPPMGFTDPSSPTMTISNLVQATYSFELKVTDNKGAVDYDTVYVFVKPSGSTNQPPIANAGPNGTITLPTSSTTLNGSGSSDPDGFIKTYSWLQISGPSQSTIVNPGAATTTVNNLVQGTYTFRLTVTDNQNANSSANVSVTVAAAGSTNQLPVANAGADITVALPTNTATLNGTASFDPDGNIVSYAWVRISGPAMGFTDPSSPTMTISNLVQATYSFQLRVTDNKGAIDYDTVNVFVNSSGPVTNQIPVANAGADITITLPTNSATLNGTASYDPDGSIASYAWVRVSGPAMGFTDPSKPTMTVSNLVQSTYLFQLKVTDNKGAWDYDTVKVTVKGSGTGQSALRMIVQEKLSIYPNPARHILHLIFSGRGSSGKTKATVYNLRGKKMLSVNFKKHAVLHHETLNISRLDRGVYLLEVIVDNKRKFILRFIKE